MRSSAFSENYHGIAWGRYVEWPVPNFHATRRRSPDVMSTRDSRISPRPLNMPCYPCLCLFCFISAPISIVNSILHLFFSTRPFQSVSPDYPNPSLWQQPPHFPTVRTRSSRLGAEDRLRWATSGSPLLYPTPGFRLLKPHWVNGDMIHSLFMTPFTHRDLHRSAVRTYWMN